jgi:hypothetical protein
VVGSSKNTRDKAFTRAKMERRLAQIEESVARYLSQLATADLQEPSQALAREDGASKGEACQAHQRAAAIEGDRGRVIVMSRR